MSLFCGLYAFDETAEVRAEWRDFLRQNLCRSGEGSVFEYSDRRLYLAKLDLGAFDDPGWLSDSAGVTALCGDSLLGERAPAMSRGVDVERLHALGVPSSDLGAALRRARGTFCAAAYRA